MTNNHQDKANEKQFVNISRLSYSLFRDIADVLEGENGWRKLAEFTLCSSPETCSKYPSTSYGEHVLYELGDQGKTVSDLLVLLDKVRLEKAQLILRRKYVPVKIVKQSAGTITSIVCGEKCDIVCKAVSFPYPRYRWFKNEVEIPDSNTHTLNVRGDCTTQSAIYRCIVENFIDRDPRYYDFYAAKGKTKSNAESKPFIVEILCDKGRHHVDSENLVFSFNAPVNKLYGLDCEGCASAEQMILLKVKSVAGDTESESALIEPPSRDNSARAAASFSNSNSSRNEKTNPQSSSSKSVLESPPLLLAVDKVALIISNSEYQFLPKLSTPACDGQNLAASLLNCDFKTVTLADLTLNEMKLVVKEYCRLLGTGVYALFYFVGHGFEIGGQCYLLPVDAPGENYTCQDCLCAEEVLSMMQETDPSLNVILLDVCRRQPGMNTIELGRRKIFKPKVNRNTVFGYATSFGEGAYEICGEINGIFMKHFIKHVEKKKPITEILNSTMRDLENDPKANDVQFPEIRTNLTKPRSFRDEMDFGGHTKTFDLRTLEWQNVHDLPDPIKVRFDELNLLIMIWFDFCGHFVNLIYIFTTVYSGVSGVLKSDSFEEKIPIPEKSDENASQGAKVDQENLTDRQDSPSTELIQDTTAKKYLAYLSEEAASYKKIGGDSGVEDGTETLPGYETLEWFILGLEGMPPCYEERLSFLTVHCTDHVLCEDQDDDKLTSVRLLVRNLQRYQHLKCKLELVEKETGEIVHQKEIVELPKMLIGKLAAWDGDCSDS